MTLLQTRLQKFSDRHGMHIDVKHGLCLTFTTFKSLKPVSITGILRTMTNAWITTSRIPQGIPVKKMHFLLQHEIQQGQIGDLLSVPSLVAHRVIVFSRLPFGT